MLTKDKLIIFLEVYFSDYLYNFAIITFILPQPFDLLAEVYDFMLMLSFKEEESLKIRELIPLEFEHEFEDLMMI